MVLLFEHRNGSPAYKIFLSSAMGLVILRPVLSLLLYRRSLATK
jgi:hypothetical protein